MTILALLSWWWDRFQFSLHSAMKMCPISRGRVHRNPFKPKTWYFKHIANWCCNMYTLKASLEPHSCIQSRNKLIRVFSCNYKREEIISPVICRKLSTNGEWNHEWCKCQHLKCKCALLRRCRHCHRLNGHVPNAVFFRFQYIKNDTNIITSEFLECYLKKIAQAPFYTNTHP